MKGYFRVSYSTNSYVLINEKIKLNAKFVLDEKEYECSFKSNNDFVSVDSNGLVTGLKEGIGEVNAIHKDNVFKFFVTVLNNNKSDLVNELLDNHYSNALTVYNLGIGSGKPAYYYDLVSSCNNLLWKDLVIDRTYNDKLPLNVKNNGYMEKVEFICVHYTGNMHHGADADNNCSYFNNLEYAASIHFVTGRTNLYRDWNKDDYMAFAGLGEQYAGWHASDTKQGPHKWLKSGVKAEKEEAPVVSISANSYFTINGKETLIKIPEREDGLKITGPTFEFEGKTCNAINKQGIAWKIIDGEYYLGNTWWGHQQFGHTLCNIGGNYNSIGIESCVDIGSDLWHTWQVTAQLVAYLLVKYDLGLDRVAGHHYFSGKDCPQPMLANDMQLWNVFMKMVKLHYDMLTKYKEYKVEFELLNNEGCTNDLGLNVQNDDAHSTLYKLNIMKDGKIVDSITLNTIIESNKEYTLERVEPSLQNQNYDIR